MKKITSLQVDTDLLHTNKNIKHKLIEKYQEESVRVAFQAMSCWNRDIASPACGSFDRVWWAWKARDFADATLQEAVELVINVADDQNWAFLMPELLTRYVDFVVKLQHTDGSFDQCYPNERTPGVFYDILPALLKVHGSKWLPSSVKLRLEKSIERGLAFALSVDEVHGEIVNHLAQFVYGLLLHWQEFGDARSLQKAKLYIVRIKRNFDEEEGWFQEYHGPDAGYQTRTLAYLTKVAEILADEILWEICVKAARFVELLLMPDGSLHPMLGVRSTALLYPSGFERLAARYSDFQPLAKRVRAAWHNNRVPLPSQLDFANALRLGVDASHAFDVASLYTPGVDEEDENSFADNGIPPEGVTHLPRAGILVIRNGQLLSWCAWRMGGTLVIWRKGDDGSWQPTHEDAGYLLQGVRETGEWITRMPNAGKLLDLQSDGVKVEAHFHRSLHEELTPTKLVLLRLLNLTVLRSRFLGDLFRRFVVSRLIGKRLPLKARMVRQIQFDSHSIQVIDSFHDAEKLPRELADAPLLRCRRVTGNNMASARYFQLIEGMAIMGPWIELQDKNIGSEPMFRFEVKGENL